MYTTKNCPAMRSLLAAAQKGPLKTMLVFTAFLISKELSEFLFTVKVHIK